MHCSQACAERLNFARWIGGKVVLRGNWRNALFVTFALKCAVVRVRKQKRAALTWQCASRDGESSGITLINISCVLAVGFGSNGKEGPRGQMDLIGCYSQKGRWIRLRERFYWGNHSRESLYWRKWVTLLRSRGQMTAFIDRIWRECRYWACLFRLHIVDLMLYNVTGLVSFE